MSVEAIIVILAIITFVIWSSIHFIEILDNISEENRLKLYRILCERIRLSTSQKEKDEIVKQWEEARKKRWFLKC